MSRLVHKATDALSEAAQRAMIAGFREKLTARMIAGRIEQETGERVAERTVSRRYSEWHLEQLRRRAAREQMLALIEAAREGNYSAAEMIQALGCDALVMNQNGYMAADPLKVQAQNLKAEELRIKRGEMDLRRRAVEVDEKKLAAALERAEKAAAEAAALEQKVAGGGQVTAEDVRRIRELYGLRGEGGAA